MPYYQILKKRRLDLNLSVQDIAIQTRLKPEYIRAIEENNLHIFSDDFSYVRYFVHSYCDAIGVNWNAIKAEVDATISAYASARDQALHQAQMKMIQSMPAARPTRKSARTTRRKRKQLFLSNHAGKMSRTLSWGSKNRLARFVLAVGVTGVLGLMALNALADNAAKASARQEQLAREQEIKDKEAQTQKLAEDLQSRKGEAPAATPQSTLSISSEQPNKFVVKGLTDQNAVVPFVITPSKEQNVSISWNDAPVFSQKISEAVTYDLEAGTTGEAVVTINNPASDDKLQVGGIEIPADFSLSDQNGQCQITLKLEYTQNEQPVSKTAAEETADSDLINSEGAAEPEYQEDYE